MAYPSEYGSGIFGIWPDHCAQLQEDAQRFKMAAREGYQHKCFEIYSLAHNHVAQGGESAFLRVLLSEGEEIYLLRKPLEVPLSSSAGLRYGVLLCPDGIFSAGPVRSGTIKRTARVQDPSWRLSALWLRGHTEGRNLFLSEIKPSKVASLLPFPVSPYFSEQGFFAPQSCVWEPLTDFQSAKAC